MECIKYKTFVNKNVRKNVIEMAFSIKVIQLNFPSDENSNLKIIFSIFSWSFI